MEEIEQFVERLPDWARWLLLLPASILGGSLAGFVIYALGSAPAANHDAPLVFIAEFVSGIASIYFFLSLAGVFATCHKVAVVVVLLALELLSLIVFVSMVSSSIDTHGVVLILGNLVGCGVGWYKLVSRKGRSSW